MNRTIPTALTLLTLLGAGATARAQQSAPVGVRDRAGMFSAEAVKEADAALREVRRQTHWSAAVETIDSLDGKPIKDVAIEKARTLQIHGLYLLLAKKDHKFYAEPSDSARKAFTREKIKDLDDAIVRAFKAGKFDQGLRDAVALIRRDAEAAPDLIIANASPAAPAQPAPPAAPDRPAAPTGPATTVRFGHTGSILPMLLIGGGLLVLFLWILSRAFRGGAAAAPQSFNQAGGGSAPGPQGPAPQPGYRPAPQPGYAPAPQPGYRPAPQAGYGPPPQPGYGPAPQPGYGYPPPPPQQAGGGGGFLSGVLGGAAGAVAGNILYDKFGRPHETPGVPPHVPAGAVPPHDPSWPHAGGSGVDTPAVAPPGETYDPNSGGGGDWGTSEPAPEPNVDASAGGDWGAAPEPNVEASAGGDWGASEPAPEPDAGGGGDWSAPDPEPDAGGGDWGASEPAPDDNQGGSW